MAEACECDCERNQAVQDHRVSDLNPQKGSKGIEPYGPLYYEIIKAI